MDHRKVGRPHLKQEVTAALQDLAGSGVGALGGSYYEVLQDKAASRTSCKEALTERPLPGRGVLWWSGASSVSVALAEN